MLTINLSQCWKPGFCKARLSTHCFNAALQKSTCKSASPQISRSAPSLNLGEWGYYTSYIRSFRNVLGHNDIECPSCIIQSSVSTNYTALQIIRRSFTVLFNGVSSAQHGYAYSIKNTEKNTNIVKYYCNF